MVKRKPQMVKTFVFFNDKFSLCVSANQQGFSLLPQWINRVIEIKEYQGELV